MSAPVRDNKQGNLGGPETPPPYPPQPQGNIGKKSGLSCPRPNYPDTKLPMRYISWWNKRANSWGICYHCPILLLKFL